MRLIYVFFLLMEHFLTDVIYSPENMDHFGLSASVSDPAAPSAPAAPARTPSSRCCRQLGLPHLSHLPSSALANHHHTPVAACQSPAGNRSVLPCTGGVLSARIVHPCPFLLHQPCSALLHTVDR